MNHNNNPNNVKEGELVTLDFDHPNKSIVKVVKLTPMELIATVQDSENPLSETWDVMTNRLSKIEIKTK